MNDTTTPMPPPPSANAAKFADLVEVRLKAGGFLTTEEEMALLEKGIVDLHLTLAEARGIVHSVADRLEAGLERGFERTMEQWMTAASGRRKRLSRSQFDHTAEVYHRQASGKMEMPDKALSLHHF